MRGVAPGGPAAKAGIKSGDVIRKFGRLLVTNDFALRWYAVASHPGTTVTLSILRNGQPMQVQVTLGGYPATSTAESGQQNGSNHGSGVTQGLSNAPGQSGMQSACGANSQSTRESAERGDASAQDLLGQCYQHGLGVVKDDLQAASWWAKAAAQGNPDAEAQLGGDYIVGDGVPRDPAKGFELTRKAAEQGYGLAEANLGVFYQAGIGVSRDYAQSLEWLRKAAAQGDGTAAYQLGVAYRDGLGVSKDPAQAFAWYLKGAQRGDERAQNAAGVAYFKGSGTPRDISQAVRWWEKAALHGNDDAKQNVLSCCHGYMQGMANQVFNGPDADKDPHHLCCNCVLEHTSVFAGQ